MSSLKFTLAMVSLAFLAALKEFFFHLTKEAARVKPMDPFLPSRVSEDNIEAATEDLRLACEPRLDSGTPDIPCEDSFGSLFEVSCKACNVSGCAEVEGVEKIDEPTLDTRLDRGTPMKAEGGLAGKCCKEAVDDLRRLVPACTKGRGASGCIVSDSA